MLEKDVSLEFHLSKNNDLGIYSTNSLYSITR